MHGLYIFGKWGPTQLQHCQVDVTCQCVQFLLKGFVKKNFHRECSKVQNPWCYEFIPFVDKPSLEAWPWQLPELNSQPTIFSAPPHRKKRPLQSLPRSKCVGHRPFSEHVQEVTARTYHVCVKMASQNGSSSSYDSSQREEHQISVKTESGKSGKGVQCYP